MSVEYLADVFIRAGDFPSALNAYSKSLALGVQIKGFDNLDTLQCHVQMSNLYLQTKDYHTSLNHLFCAKYIVNLIGGPHHPELITVLHRLALVYLEMGDWDVSYYCLTQACNRAAYIDQPRHFELCFEMSMLLVQAGRFKEGVDMQKQCFVLSKQLFGPDHTKTSDVKSQLEKSMRAMATVPKVTAQVTNQATAPVAEQVEEKKDNKKSSSKKNKGGKKK